MNKKLVQARIEKELHDEFAEKARKSGQSVAGRIKWLIERDVKKGTKK